MHSRRFVTHVDSCGHATEHSLLESGAALTGDMATAGSAARRHSAQRLLPVHASELLDDSRQVPLLFPLKHLSPFVQPNGWSSGSDSHLQRLSAGGSICSHTHIPQSSQPPPLQSARRILDEPVIYLQSTILTGFDLAAVSQEART